MYIVQPSQPVPLLGYIQRSRRYMDRQFVLSLINSGETDVVGMVMRYDYRIDVPDISSMVGKLAFSIRTAYACVKQKPYASRFDVNAVAVASRLKRYCNHEFKL